MARKLSLSVGVLALLLFLLGQAPAGGGSATFTQYAVAADSELASRAGAEVLGAGGNAADAAAATMLALGVVHPHSSGLGGGGFALYYRASDQSFTFLDFRERAPAAATPGMFAGQQSAGGPASRPSQLGGLAAGVPGEPAGIDLLVRRFGSGRVDLSAIAAPAIRMASNGVPVDRSWARAARSFAGHILRDPVMRRWFRPGARALERGQVVRQPALARTLRAFGRRGARAIYSGRIARSIVSATTRHGGIMTLADLRDYQVAVREPLVANHVGFRWVTAPPPSAGGYTMLASLGLLERWVPEGQRAAGGAELMHAFAESWKGPFWDRASYFGDPDHVRVPLGELLAPDRVARRAAVFRPSLAIPVRRYALPLRRGDRGLSVPRDHGTSHLCVVDAEGNVLAATTTVNLLFGARYTASGIVMNDEMDDFASAVGEANAFGLPGGAPNRPAPGKRPVSSMTPSIVLDASGPVLCVGASGGSRIVTATQQVAWHALVRGLSPAEALAQPRVHHQGIPNQLRVEQTHPLSAETAEQLVARGHELSAAHHSAVVQLIRIVRQDGERRLIAASDPRKGGAPAGR